MASATPQDRYAKHVQWLRDAGTRVAFGTPPRIDAAFVLQQAKGMGPWRRMPNGVVMNPKGWTPLEAVAHQVGVRFGLRHQDVTTPPDTSWLLPRAERDMLERAATVRPPLGEADLESPAVIACRMTMLTWCGWRTAPERWSLRYDRWLGPPTATTRMIVEGVGLIALFALLWAVFAIAGE